MGSPAIIGIVEQWTADEQGNEHPPYLGTVLEWYDEDETVLTEYRDYPGETERVQLDDPTTHRFWKLLQTKQHLFLFFTWNLIHIQLQGQRPVLHRVLRSLQSKRRHGHRTALGPPRIDDQVETPGNADPRSGIIT